MSKLFSSIFFCFFFILIFKTLNLSMLQLYGNLNKSCFTVYLLTSYFSFLFLEQFHIFVGDLSSEIETQQLREAFTPFGEIS